MSDKKQEKLTYALTESSAVKQISEANRLRKRAKSLLSSYICDDVGLKYAGNVVDVLAEYMANTKFYIDVLERQLFSGDRIKNKKTGEDNIVVPYEDFALISSYLVVTAACENDLESLGISMRLH
tara:strand:- start:474 stop:848 length:375 start_codon:yes stop_codon:yes gene_type:complete